MYKIVGDNELEGYAFFDSELYCVSIRTLKNYVFIADAFHSVALLMWRVRTAPLPTRAGNCFFATHCVVYQRTCTGMSTDAHVDGKGPFEAKSYCHRIFQCGSFSAIGRDG